MEFHNVLGIDLQTETFVHIGTERSVTLENTRIKQEPVSHTTGGSAYATENTKYAADVANTVGVKAEVIDNDYYQNTDTQYNAGVSNDSNYADTGMIRDTHVTPIKWKPVDEPVETNENQSKFIFEIDTCKDEYYELHGYPNSHDNVHLGDNGVHQGPGGDCVSNEDMYMEHIDTQDKGWAAPYTSVDTTPCTVVLHDIQYSYQDILTQGYVNVHEKEPTIQLRVQPSTFSVHASQQSKHKPYWCSVCGVGFMHKGHLNTHMRIHTGEKPHICSVCEVGFRQKCHLASHMRTHTGEKPYKCIMCGVDFSEKNHLTSHHRIHTGEKPHTCSVCKVSFTQKGNLTSHMRTHTGEKPYTCPVCGVDFSRKLTLMTHQRIHTGEKPHKCDVCKISFTWKNNLTSHMKTHTGEKPYKCSVCGVGFTQTSHRKTHTRIHT